MKRNTDITTPISSDMKRIYSLSGEICFAYTKTTLFKVAKITYDLFEDESYQYIFEPYYDVVDGLAPVDWGGIPGINLDLRRERYYRVGVIPTFISERTPSPSRVNLKEELERANLDYMNRLQWLINTDTIYTGDKLIVEQDGFNNFTGFSTKKYAVACTLGPPALGNEAADRHQWHTVHRSGAQQPYQSILDRI